MAIKKNCQIAVRLSETMVEDIEHALNQMESNPDWRALGITRATVIRIAIAKGLKVLEKENYNPYGSGHRWIP